VEVNGGAPLRPGWTLPLQRLSALLKRRNKRTEGGWKLNPRQLQVRLEELLEGDALYGIPPSSPAAAALAAEAAAAAAAAAALASSMQQQQQHPHHHPHPQQLPSGSRAGRTMQHPQHPPHLPAGSSSSSLLVQQQRLAAGQGLPGLLGLLGGGGAGGSPVDAFLRDLGATPAQVLEVLELPDIDANIGFCAECGLMGGLVACDTCVDSFCCGCLGGVDPEELPDSWKCRYCEQVRLTDVPLRTAPSTITVKTEKKKPAAATGPAAAAAAAAAPKPPKGHKLPPPAAAGPSNRRQSAPASVAAAAAAAAAAAPSGVGKGGDGGSGESLAGGKRIRKQEVPLRNQTRRLTLAGVPAARGETAAAAAAAGTAAGAGGEVDGWRKETKAAQALNAERKGMPGGAGE
ncbi:hypothetical protein Agub_g2540, partial [Astrephomene gubernaculifera]